jgi:UDP-GlcNAc:undecaprenyl-phosphate GlcNAc-1-phosphate transferase
MLAAMTPFYVGFLVTITLMLALRPIAAHLGLVDMPGGRKTHSGAVPVVGGIAMFFGMLASVLAVGVSWAGESALLVAAALMVGVGALDDRFNLAPYTRIVAHIAAAVTLVLASGYRVESLGNLLGLGAINLGAFDLLFTVVATIALINGFNMLDGLDGLAGGVAQIGLIGLTYYFLNNPMNSVAILSIGLVGSVAAFLIFNLPAKFNRPVLAFMGDAGSTFLGFVIAGLALVAVQLRDGGLPPVVVLWLLPVPIIELFSSTFRRLKSGFSPMQADRGHFHHQLLEGGFSVRAIFLLYLAVSSVAAVTGLLMWRAGFGEPTLFFSFVAFSVLWLLAIRNVRRLVAYLPKSLKRGKWPHVRFADRSRHTP